MTDLSKKPTERSLFRSTAIFASMTMLSRVLGLMRDVIIAQYFGAQASADAFYVAFKIPNFMRRLFAEGAFSQAFVPLLAEYKETKDQSAMRDMIASVSGVLFWSLLLVVLLGIIFSPWLVRAFAPGFVLHGTRFALTAHLLQIMFPYLLLISLVACVTAVLNTYGIFGPSAFVPVLLNICLIVAAVYLTPYFDNGVSALAWAVCVAGFIQLVFLLPFLRRIKLWVWPRCRFHDPAVKRVLRLMGPAVIGASVAQINLLIDTILASLLPVGSVSWLYYSARLMNFPLGIFGVALSTVVLPSLSSEYAKQDETKYSNIVDWGLRSVLLIGVPAAIGLILLAMPIMNLIFHYGAFGSRDVINSANALMAFSLGIPAYMMVKVLVSAFYARQQMRTPVKIAVVALLANVLFSVCLMQSMCHVGLALSMSLSGYLNAILLCFALYKKGFYRSTLSRWLRYLSQLAIANGMMVLAVLGIKALWPVQWGGRFLFVGTLILVACAVYFITLYAMGLRVRDFKQSPTVERV